MKLFDPETWPTNPTERDRRKFMNMYAEHQIFKLKVTIVLGVVVLVRAFYF